MPTIPKICIQVEADVSKFTITDDTGVFVQDFNDSGYGTLNIDRVNFASVLLAYYQSYDNTKQLISDLSINIDYNTDATNTYKTQFELAYSNDGWYQFNYILVPLSITPAGGAIFYSVNLEKLMQYKASLAEVDVYDISFLITSSDYLKVISEGLYTGKLSMKKNELSREYLACKQCIECGCKEELDNIIHLREGLQSAHSHFSIAPLESQKFIERLTKQYRIK